MPRILVCVAIAACIIGGTGDALSTTGRTLPAEARWVANHGGVRSHRYGDATPRMKALVRALIRRTFKPAGWRAVAIAECFSRRESGYNPGAISPSGDYSSFQVNAPTHPQFDYWRMDHDPAYGVQAGWIVSDHGTNWHPWDGGVYPCG